MLGMVVVHRAHGFRFVIYTLDHEPAHVHIIGADGHAKVNLLGPGGQPELVSKTIRRSDRAADLNEEQLKRAEARGRKMLEEPRAAAAHYDAATGRVVVDLANGCAYAFPTRHIQDLHDASGEDLAKIEVDGAGFNLRWPSLDVDLYVPALVNGIFGNRAWIARELARLAGRTRSPKKAAASHSNGAKGGRPRRAAKS